MARFLLEDETDPLQELKNLLDYNRIQYLQEDGGVRFALEEAGCRWEVIGKTAGRVVMIYGVYPFPVGADARTQAEVNRMNGALVRGSLFLTENRAVIRTSADLMDAYGAYEAIARALEYNAGAMIRFWAEMAGCAK